MVHAFKDNFLMEAAETDEASLQFCNMSNQAEDQLAALAELVGRGDKLSDPVGEPVATDFNFDEVDSSAEVAPLEYDLEAELARALDSADAQAPAASETTAAATPDIGSTAAPVDAPTMEFNSMISEEFERALQEQAVDVAPASADVAHETQPPQEAPIPVFPSPVEEAPVAVQPATAEAAESDNIFADELTRMLAMQGEGGEAVSPDAAPVFGPSDIPAPKPVAPEMFVPEELAMPTPPPVEAVPEMDNRAQPAKDYSDPAAEFQTFFEQADASSEPVSSEQQSAPSVDVPPVDTAPSEAVLGASAALGAAASLGLSKLDKPEPEISLGNFDDSQSEMPEINLDDDLTAELDAAFNASMDVDDDIAIPEAHIAEQSTSNGGGRKAAIIILAIAFLGGAGAWAYNMFGDNGAAPVILADADAVKVKPKDSGGQIVPNQDQTVYKTVDGSQDSNAGQTKLKNTTEQPIQVAKTESRAPVSSGDGDDLLRPRAVRTVVVKPDGTIVSSTEPAQVASVDTSSLVPVTTLEPKPVETVSVKPVVKPLEPAPAENNDGSQVEVAKVEVQQPKPVEVKPVVVKPVAKKVEPQKVAVATQPQPKPAPKPAAVDPIAAESLPSVSSPYAVQVSARRSPESAKEAWSKISRRYASVLGGYNVDIRRSEVKGKGVYYRVRVPASSKQNAQRLCAQLKSAGGDCLVTR